MEEIYLIEECVLNPWANEPEMAVNWQAIGFAMSKEAADSKCKDPRMYTQKDCWAITQDLPRFRVTGPVKNIYVN